MICPEFCISFALPKNRATVVEVDRRAAVLKAGRSPVYFSTVTLVGQDGESSAVDLPDVNSEIFLRQAVDQHLGQDRYFSV